MPCPYVLTAIMALHKGILRGGWLVTDVEKHFHDYDEVWLTLGGRGTSYWIDHEGNRAEFELEEGDVWMIPAGFEHGSDGPNSPDFKLAVLNGTLAPGCQPPGHLYIEKEGYIPSLELKKTPTNRYKAEGSKENPCTFHFPTQISSNGRYLCRADGSPFFYLADTAWELLHLLNREETEWYLRDRAAKGFTVIQSVILAELDGLNTSNRAGDLPLHQSDPTRPNERYFQHVDWVLERAGELGLCVGLLPTWGDKWNLKWGVGPEIFTPENATIYGEWLGQRYQNSPLIWILGGDRPIETEDQRAIIENMAAGLKKGDGGRHLMTFHPSGCRSSSEWFHQASWLDFNMAQTGHAKTRANDQFIAADYALKPTKPCLDGEPGYEAIWDDLQVGNELLNASDVRRFCYQSLFSGACGHTYGANPVWQMWQEGREALFGASGSWREALQLPGATQMGYARRLLESRGFGHLFPAPQLILEGQKRLALRDENNSCALIYFTDNAPTTLDLTSLAADIRAYWFDPRTGTSEFFREFSDQKIAEFAPPTSEDWVLVLDDTMQDFAPPGKR